MNTRQKQPTTLANNQDQLIELALEGLKNMYDAKSGLFCFRVVKKNGRLMQEGTSLRYSLITLLGLEQCRRNGIRVAFDLDELFRTVWIHSKGITSIGDYGLLMWLTSNLSSKNLPELTDKSVLAKMLETSKDARENRTMEMSWFLIGLCHAFCGSNEKEAFLKRFASSMHSLLMKNYGGNGIFGHKNNKSVTGLLRGRIGSFADQVYPILALTKYGQVFGKKESIEIALECAKHICKLQGPLGQWWWHYDAIKGNVLSRYPIYSVHQDSMAPMALFRISDATGHDFSNSIYGGIKWIYGFNELNQEMIDYESEIIWRCLFRKRYISYLEEIFSVLRPCSKTYSSNNVSTKWECRPYHLGWILYTFAGRLSIC